ncbi:amidohydrolase family protein [Paraglaciecola sp.]|uniref:amidohydrolase family protein n=1 Tax=Paraglaciecola sp. TaxID=1920173 RepID=UPI003EF8C66B
MPFRLFRFVIILILFISLAGCINIDRPTVPAKTNHYVITNVHLVDVVNKQIRPKQNVEIKQGVIHKIYQGEVKFSEQSPIQINGTGKYLLPGLWDNHSTVIQLSPEIDFPLYIANGVTSVRSNLSCPNENKTSMYACQKDKAKWKKQVLNGQMVGPTIQGWGTFPVNGNKSTHPNSPDFHGAGNAQQAQSLVKYYKAFDNDERPFFIKTYNKVTKDGYFALAEHAQKNGFELSGHKPRAISLEELVNAGQRSVAHARLFLYDCSLQADSLLRGEHWGTPLPEFYRFLIANFDNNNCQSKYKMLADNQVFINPTLMTRRNDYYAVAGLQDEINGLDYAHYMLKREWQEDVEKLGTDLSEKDIKAFEDFYHLSADTIKQAHLAGVSILAGTDSWSEYNVPGFSLHEELQALHEAGLDNFSILQAATINGAKYFRISDKIGSIDIGKQADMLLLDADPTADIHNTQNIHTVFKGETIYSNNELEKLKTDVKELAGSHKVTAKLIGLFLSNPGGF